MASLADLLIKVGIDPAPMVKGLQEVSKSARDLDKEAKAIEKSFDGFTKIGGRIQGIGTAITAGITLPIIGAGAGLVGLSLKFDDAFNKIRSGTGKTGDALKGLQDDFTKVFENVPNTAEEVSTAIADLNTRLNLAGEPLQNMATQMLNLARITGEQVQPLIASTTRVFGDWGVKTEDQAGKLDYLYRVAQSTGIGVGKLADGIVQFGAPLRQMGFDMDTAAALMGKFEKEGVNVELVLGSMRQALGKMAQMGITDAGEALKVLTDQIKGAGSVGEANAKAMEIFGARAGPDMAAAIREGRFAIGDLVKELQASGESINKAAKDTMTFSQQMKQLGNEASVALKPFGDALVRALQSGLEAAKPLIGYLKEIAEGFASADQSTQTWIIGLAGAVAAIGPLTWAIGTFIKSIGTIAGAVTTASGGISKLIAPVGELGTSLTLLRGTVVLAAGAFAGWEIGSWLYKNSQAFRDFGDGLGDLISKIPGLTWAIDKMTGASKGAATATRNQADSTKLLEEKLRAAGIVIDKAGMSADQYSRALFDAAKNLSDVGGKQSVFRSEVDKAKEAIQKADQQSKAYNTAMTELGKATKTAGDAHKEATPKIFDAASAMQKMGGEMEVLAEQYRRHEAESQALVRAYVDLRIAQEQGLVGAKAFAATLAEMSQALGPVNVAINDIAEDGLPKINHELLAGPPAMDAFGEAMRGLGIESQTALEMSLDSMRKWRDEILGSNLSTDFEKKTAVYKVLAAEIAQAEKFGKEVPEAQRKALEQMEQDLNITHDKMKTQWSELGTQVSTIMTNAVQDIAKSLFDGNLSLVEKGKAVLKSLGEAFTSSFIQPATEALNKFINGAIKSLFTNLEGLKANFSDLGTTISKIFGLGGGGGGAVPAAIPAGGAAIPTGGAPSAPGGGAGGLAGAASGLTGALTAVGSLGTMVSSIIGNFQTARLEGTMNQVERNTAAASIHLQHILEDSLNVYLPNLQLLNDFNNNFWAPQVAYIESMMEDMQRTGGLPAGSPSGGGETVNNITINVAVNGAIPDNQEQIDKMVDTILDQLNQRQL